MKGARVLFCALALALGTASCGTFGDGASRRSDVELDGTGTSGHERTPSETALGLRFSRRLLSDIGGRLVPVEHAGVALDATRDRLYVGLGDGTLRAHDSNGREIYRYDAHAPIDATPALDRSRNVLYVASNDGMIHALQASDGRLLWKESAGHPIAQDLVLTSDVIFVVSEDDVVSAIERSDGTVLWNYRRPPAEEITIKGHAGLTLLGTRLYTAFNDGVIVALDSADGSAIWELDTSADLESGGASGAPRFRDVDSTPVIIGSKLYASSFSTGLYTLDLENGSVLDRDAARTGIVGLDAVGENLLVTSADSGISLVEPATKRSRWTKAIDRGAPTRPCITSSHVAIYGESVGSLIAVRLDTGDEVGRFESGFGFIAPTRSMGNLAAVVSNSGTLYVIDLY